MSFSQTIADRGNDPAWNRWDSLILAMADGDVSAYALIKGVIARESEWVEGAVNQADPSYGLMQILAGARGPYPTIGTADLLDGGTNIVLGSRFLKTLLSRYAVPDAISAYNAGHPISGNRAYVDDIQTYQVYYLNTLPTPFPLPDTATEPAIDAQPTEAGSQGGLTSTEIGVGTGAGLLAISLAIWWLSGVGRS